MNQWQETLRITSAVAKLANVAGLSIMLCLPACALMQKGADDATQAQRVERTQGDAAAIKFWNAAISKNPTNASWFASRAEAYLRLRDFKHALADFDSSLKLEPFDIKNMQLRPQCFMGLHDDSAAIAAINEELALNPADGGMHLTRAIILERLGKHDEAERDRQAMKRYGFTDKTLRVLQEAGSLASTRPRVAVSLLQTQIRDANNCPDLYFALAGILADNSFGDLQPAIQAAEECCSVAPKYSWVWRQAHVFQGNLYSESRTVYRALSEYDIALDGVTQGNGHITARTHTSRTVLQDGLHGRAQAYAALIKADKAIKDESTLMKFYPHFSNAPFARAKLYALTNQPQKALADNSLALSIDPDNTDYRMQQLLLLKTAHQYPQALTEANILIKLSPGDELLYDQRADIYQKLGHYKKAVDEYTRMLRESPDEARFYKMRAACYRKLGQEALAAADEKRAKPATRTVTNVR